MSGLSSGHKTKCIVENRKVGFGQKQTGKKLQTPVPVCISMYPNSNWDCSSKPKKNIAGSENGWREVQNKSLKHRCEFVTANDYFHRKYFGSTFSYSLFSFTLNFCFIKCDTLIMRYLCC